MLDFIFVFFIENNEIQRSVDKYVIINVKLSNIDYFVTSLLSLPFLHISGYHIDRLVVYGLLNHQN